MKKYFSAVKWDLQLLPLTYKETKKEIFLGLISIIALFFSPYNEYLIK